MEDTIDNTLNKEDGKGITIRRSPCTLFEPEVLEDCNIVDNYIVSIISERMPLRVYVAEHDVIV